MTRDYADTAASDTITPDSLAVARAVGETIQELRMVRRRSVGDVAKRMGVSARHLAELENAKHPTALRMWHIIDVCRALDVEPMGLLLIALAKAFPDGWEYDGAPEETIEERVIRAQTLTRNAVQSER